MSGGESGPSAAVAGHSGKRRPRNWAALRTKGNLKRAGSVEGKLAGDISDAPDASPTSARVGQTHSEAQKLKALLEPEITAAVEAEVAKRIAPLEQRLERLEGKNTGPGALVPVLTKTNGAGEEGKTSSATASVESALASETFSSHRARVTPELLDIGGRYEMAESVWDMVVFVGHPVIGFLNTCVLSFAWLLNLLLQTGFIYVIQKLMMQPAVSAEVLDGLLKFRLGLAHKAEFADKVTQRSMADQVCSQEKKLHMAGEQVALYQDFFNFVEGGLEAQGLILFVQFLWLCTIAKDVNNTVTMARAVWKTRRGTSTKLLIADLIEEDLEHERVLVTEAQEDGAPESSGNPRLARMNTTGSEDPGPDLAGMMTVVRMTKIKPARVWLVLLCVTIPKLALAVALYVTGAVWLGNTANFSELILNGVALAFVLEFDEVLFEVFVPRRSKTLRSNFEALPMHEAKPGSKASGVAVIFKALGLTAAMVCVYMLVLEPVFWMLKQGEAIVCSGDTKFIYTVNPATKMVHVSEMMGEDRYTDTELIIAQVSRVDLWKHDAWNDLLHASVFDAAKSDFSRAVIANSPDSFNEIVQMSKSSLADAASALPCQDLASGRSEEASLQALRVLLADDNISSCRSIPRDWCAKRSMAELRAICPRHCRCEEALLNYVGFFGKVAFGCPMQCETFKAATNEINFRFDLTKSHGRRLTAPSPVPPPPCQNGDENVTDSLGGSCDGAYANSSSSSNFSSTSNASNSLQTCGAYDDTDFTAGDMCCGCGGGAGGGLPNVSLNSPPTPSPSTSPPTPTGGNASSGQSLDEGDNEIGSLGCEDLASAEFSFPGGCSDSNGEKQLDKRGRDCAYYVMAPSTCGQNDDDDFNASALCCACGGGAQGVPGSLACWDEFVEAAVLPEECWRMPRKALSWLFYVKGLFESLEFNSRFADGVRSVVAKDYAGIDPNEEVQKALTEHITTGAMGRAMANGSWDLMAGLPHPRGLTGCNFLASYEITSLLNLELCAEGDHTPIRFFCPASCGCDSSRGMNECPAGCVLTGCLDNREACQHVHPWFSDECIAGWHNNGGEPTCYRCSGGTTRRRRSTTCTDCQNGYFDSGDNDDCRPCPGGTTTRRRSSECTACDPGFYDAGNFDDCTQCLGGATRRRSSDSCTECEVGYHDSGDADDCSPNVGCETRRRRALGCSGCLPGHYNGGGSSDDCIRCENGQTRRRDSRETASSCTPCPAGYYDAGDLDDCVPADCPANSIGQTVPKGCSCDATSLGAIRALAEPPYYSGACPKVPIYLQDWGRCRYDMPADRCKAAAEELVVGEFDFYEADMEEYEGYDFIKGCAWYPELGLVLFNTKGGSLCRSSAHCICAGDPSAFPCADHPASFSPSTGWNRCDDVTVDYCMVRDTWERWLDDSEFTASEMCCKCGSGVTTNLQHPFCEDTAPEDATSSNGFTQCWKWDWMPSTCRWSRYYDDDDFSAADMCCACNGGARFTTTETSSSTLTSTSVTSSTTLHSTTQTSSMSSSTTAHSTTGTSTETTPILSILDGPCVVSGDCVSSPNYPAPYGTSEYCSISVDNREGELPFSVMHFATEREKDVLRVDGVEVSGSPPQIVAPTSSLTWTSDGDTVGEGWELCFGCVDNDAAFERWAHLADPGWMPQGCRGGAVYVCGYIAMMCCATCEEAESCGLQSGAEVKWMDGPVHEQARPFNMMEEGPLGCCYACKAAEGCAAWNLYQNEHGATCLLAFPGEGVAFQFHEVKGPGQAESENPTLSGIVQP